jgi:predicted Zn-ribbon and HTH transcriptional regulator
VPERDVVGHLEHLERTAKARGETFIVEPARCDECDFVFKKRERLGRPSKCPKCRSTHLVPPRFMMRPE